jgi:hypothetical protein
VQLALRVSKVFLEHSQVRVTLALLALRVTLVLRVLLVTRVFREQRVSRETPVLKVSKVSRA